MNKSIKPQERVGNLIKAFPGEWVTLSSDKSQVVGHAKRMETALSQAYKKGENQPFLIKSPDGSTAAFIY